MSLRICQVTPGIISIPPKSWGAVEKIIWNYKKYFERLGHICDIKYLDEINSDDYDIIHIHTAYLAAEANKKGLKYVYSMHDHHVDFQYGTWLVNQEAIDNSILSFVHAEYLIEKFQYRPQLHYLTHGVDEEIYKHNPTIGHQHKLLCVGNNGLNQNSTIDRKGFLPAIEVSKKLNLPLTIVGPTDCNRDFFQHYNVTENKLLKIIYDPSEDELIDIYRNHTIFLHPSDLEAGKPNLTLLEATSCGLPIVGTMSGNNIIPSMYITNRDVELLYQGIKFIINNYDYFKLKTKDISHFYWKNVTNSLLNYYKSVVNIEDPYYQHKLMKKSITSLYNETVIKTHNYTNKIHINYLDGAKVTINGFDKKDYKVQFINNDSDEIIHETVISTDMWSAPNRKYYTNWKIKINDEIHLFNIKNKRVLITFNSSALGDTLAWIPYVDEFRKKHKCQVSVTTFHNWLFEDVYPEIEFLEPGQPLNPYYAWYQIGVFDKEGKDDLNRNVHPWREIPLQQTITDILGLQYQEIQPKIVIPKNKPIFSDRYVVICPQSTLKAKLWNNDKGWNKTVNYLKKLGYKVISISKDSLNIPNTIDFHSKSLQDVSNVIYYSEFVIGLGSGPSWMAWAYNKPIIMISGFSKPYSEFKCYRLYNEDVCNGCYNDISVPFDRGDWNWCPFKKDFECSKSITSSQVITMINTVMKENNFSF